jgi:hypothetical protein
MILPEDVHNGQQPGMPWCHSPFFDQILTLKPLTPEQRGQAIHFNQHGYLIVQLDLEPELIDTVVAAMQVLPHKLDGWVAHPAIKQLATLPQLLRVVRMLYGREPIPFQTLNYMSSPEQGIHSDMLHFNSFPMHYMCAAWIALEDVDIDAGPLFYYPGSHRLPFYDFTDVGLPVTTEPDKFHENLGLYTEWLQQCAENHRLQKRLFTCRRGQALIWAANMMHGSVAITKPGGTRMSQVNHYFFHGCTYYTPAYSDLSAGRIFHREPIDIRTGFKHVKPVRKN